MKIEDHPDYKLYAKSGWQGKDGWYIGYIETQQGTWLFANHLTIHQTKELSLRKQIVMDALRLTELIP